MNLEDYGWDARWRQAFDQQGTPDMLPARVVAVFSGIYEIMTAEGKGSASMSGKLRYNSLYAAKRPTAGDWVTVLSSDGGTYTITGILPRRSCLQRQDVDDVEAQVIGANVDVCLIVQAVQGDFNIARIDRYQTMIWNSGATPAIVLSKVDALSAAEIEQRLSQIETYFPGVEVFPVSSFTGNGIGRLKEYLQSGKTYAAMGSSGVGKSTLLNVLAAEELMRTAEVRDSDQRGRHTTTHRQLFLLPNGALYLDTPGMREMDLFDYDGIDRTFQDIRDIAVDCRFADCTHQREPGCAIQTAIKSGRLDAERLASYVKLKKEEQFYCQKQISLRAKLSKARIKRRKVHYKDFTRNGSQYEDDI